MPVLTIIELPENRLEVTGPVAGQEKSTTDDRKFRTFERQKINQIETTAYYS